MPTTVRDALWMWGHPVNAHGPQTRWKLPHESRMTPLEAAAYMGTPNMHMIWLWREEAPEPLPSWRQFALPLRACKRVVWSIAHGHGLSFTDHIFPLIQDSPNVTGVIMDDFFTDTPDGKITAISGKDLDSLEQRLRLPDRRLDLWCVVYEQDLAKPISATLDRMDVLAYFMWNSPSVPKLESHVEALERLAPTKRKVLGLYLWDYAGRKPMPMEFVKFQSELALRLLKAGRIEGIVFVASCICDLELEAVEWTREWIQRVGDDRLD
ncbi:MAG: hypothetical protein NTW19_20080 [Planctomycetota bacterium]|nr:hypothetical protein [Planctomycetota bacterium]